MNYNLHIYNSNYFYILITLLTMKMKSLLSLVLLCLFTSIMLSAQDPVFSQFLKSKEYFNPAYTGIGGGWAINLQARSQWSKIQGTPIAGAYETQFISTSYSFSEEKNSLGFYLFRNREGSAYLETLAAGMNYCYVLPLRLNKPNHNQILRFGFGLNYAQKRIDWDQLIFSDQLDAKEGLVIPASAHSANFDRFENNYPWWTALNMGAVYRYLGKDKNNEGFQFDLGFSATQLTSLFIGSSVESLQNLRTTGLSTRYTLNGQIYLPGLQMGSKANYFTPFPAFRFAYQEGISVLTLGADLYFQNIMFGAYYQNTINPIENSLGQSTDALILYWDIALPFAENSGIEIGFSYDINLNGLANYTGGVFELSMKYLIPPTGGKVICPAVSNIHRRNYNKSFHRNRKNKNLN